MKVQLQNLSFILGLLGVFYVFNFWELFFDFPKGVHFIRQTDSLSFASNYYHNSFNFFKPSLFNLMSDNGNAACEFPILYYLTAIIYTVVGEHSFVLRTIHLLIFFIGCYHLYNLSMLVLNDYLLSYLSVFFLFSSVSLMYYSFNFLPDIAALGLVFSGWYYYFRYDKTQSNKFLTLTFFFFTFSALLKVTYSINLIVFVMVVIFGNQNKLKETIQLISLRTLLSSVVILSWNIYVVYYNHQNNSTYFTTSIMPIWELSMLEVKSVWKDAIGEWYKKYLAESSFHFLIILLIVGFSFHFKKISNLKFVIIFLFLGGLSYFLLFFKQFRYHDYYFLLFIPLLFFILLQGNLFILSFRNNKKWFQVSFKLIFSIVVISGLNYSRLKVQERYDKGRDDFSQIAFKILENNQFLKTLNFNKGAKVIIASDKSINGGLYFLKTKGWAIAEIDNSFLEKVCYLKGLGANYLLLFDYNEIDRQILNEIGEKLDKNQNIILYHL